VRSAEDLVAILQRIDGRGYKAYRDILDVFAFDGFTLFLDQIQGDPFAAPTKLRLRVLQERARIPRDLFDSRVRHIAIEDFLARQVRAAIREESRGRRGSGKSGAMNIDAGRQEVLERTALVVTPDWVEARIEIGLPASGRRVLGRQAEMMLCGELPLVAERALLWENLPQEEARSFVDCIENQEFIRSQLANRDLVAFVGNGAILPRESGASDRPLPAERAIPFEAPESLRVALPLARPLPDGRTSIEGLGISTGVTLIVGGGYHGKSTLLKALERSVYPHVPGDGREWVVSAPDLMKIRAEDGRRVEQVDIGAFIGELPQGRSTENFSSDDASGSTSQAANIVEAVEVGVSGLLLDEDTSATNFMVRDARMQALVHKEDEPITPFVERVRELYQRLGISTVLVMGGCGDYFDVADTVIGLREFIPYDASAEARAIAAERPSGRRSEATKPLARVTSRHPCNESFDPSRGRRDEQLVDPSQTRAVGLSIHLATERFMKADATLCDVIERIEAFFDERGLDELDPYRAREGHPGNFARPRRFEIAAAINRLRTLKMSQQSGGKAG